ncbi:MAG: phospholipid carrier-dependent glycosyltransferase [Phycisphaerales bacterium]|nr:phospholipid carrier-dependent glycosyltransferase [Phycisphaerales bacterium]
MTAARFVLVAILVFVFGYLAFGWARPLVVPDETRYAVIPAEMLERGDLVVPRLLGIRYFEKPAGGYWLVAGAMATFGQNAFAMRLPAALATGLSALLLGVFVRAATRRTDLAALSAMVYLTMIMVVLVGTTNILDAPFAAMLTGSIVCAWMGLESGTRGRGAAWLAVAGLFCGGAFLVKGFLAVVLPAAVLGPYLLWNRRWLTMIAVPWIPLGVASLVVLPWAVLVHRDAPGFWHEFFWVEHIQRFTSPDDNQHHEPFWYFLPVLFMGALPWLIAAPIACLGWSRDDLKVPWVRFMICWFTLPFLFFSLSSGKLPTYILPVMAPLAIFLATGLVRRFSSRSRPVRRFDFAPGILLLGAALLILVEWPLNNLGLKPWGPGGDWRYLLLACGLTWWGVFDWAAIRSRIPERRVLFMACSPVLVLATMPVLFPTGIVSERKAPMAFIAEHRDRLTDPGILLSDNHLAHSVALDSGRRDLLILGDPSEFDNGLGHPDEEARLLSLESFKEMLAAPDRSDVVLVLDQAGMQRTLDSGVPEPDHRIVGSRLVIATWNATR